MVYTAWRYCRSIWQALLVPCHTGVCCRVTHHCECNRGAHDAEWQLLGMQIREVGRQQAMRQQQRTELSHRASVEVGCMPALPCHWQSLPSHMYALARLTLPILMGCVSMLLNASLQRLPVMRLIW